MKKLRTHEEAKQWLQYQGISVSQWCRENNFSVSLVFEILSGRKKCLRGMSHNIAVALCMKDGVPPLAQGAWRHNAVRRPTMQDLRYERPAFHS